MSLLDNASLLLTPNAYKASKLYSVIPSNGNGDFTATRATTATRINSSGLVENVALNVPRLDYSLGGCPSILLEPQRTNSVLNSSMVGAVAGSPGTAPTGWAFNGGGGLTRTISLGTENGLPYIDFRFQGTATQTFLTILPTPSSTSASATQNWNFSLYAKLVSGTLPSPRLNILASGGTAQTQVITLTSSLQRFDTTFLNLPVGTTNVRPYLDSNTLSIGTAYDFTIRIAAPQLEAGAYATSFIPTTTASVTRNQDVVIKTGVSSLIGQAQGTLFLEARSFNFLGNGAGERISLTDGTFNNRVNIDLFTGGSVQMVLANSTTGLNGTITAAGAGLTNNSKFKIAVAYDGANSRLYVNGTAYTTIVGTIPTFSGQLSVVEFNQGNTARPFFGRVEELIVFPTRLSNAQLAQLTTL